MEMETKKAKWSELPPELWPLIGNRLDNCIDVLRFRSVCKLWRSSLSPSQQSLALPPPDRFSSSSDAMDSLLFQSTLYRMESIVAGDEPNPPEPWLLKLEVSNSYPGRMRIVHPISNEPLRYSPIGSSKEFNLLDFRVVELRKTYNLRTFGKNRLQALAFVEKVVAVGPNHWDDRTIFRLNNGGRLRFLRFGEEKWTYVDGKNSKFDDVIVYMGECYVVDRLGTISWVHPELSAIQFSSPLCVLGCRKHLVECCGDLYVVDRYVDNGNGKAVGFKVYKLDQEWGRWDEVKYLGDQVFILSNDGSFSVSARDFVGVKGNCILFTNLKLCHAVAGRAITKATWRSSCNHVFNLEDRSIRALAALPGYSRMLSPPAAWLSADDLSEC